MIAVGIKLNMTWLKLIEYISLLDNLFIGETDVPKIKVDKIMLENDFIEAVDLFRMMKF